MRCDSGKNCNALLQQEYGGALQDIGTLRADLRCKLISSMILRGTVLWARSTSWNR